MMTALEQIETHKANSQWIERNYHELVENYENQHIAVWDEKVVASAASLDELHKKIEQNEKIPSKENLTIERITKEPVGMLL